MGKEMLISSNRHETKVAVLEDDQLVEIYFQRSDEYSLAGSIHKGRVTRVLPGMQSAFVNIGLDRDAFLYVSDFLEDQEEYDKIASTAEEKATQQFEKRMQSPPAEPVIITPSARETAAGPVGLAAPASVPPAEARTHAGAPSSELRETPVHGDRERGGDRDRRGRRSRRRRFRDRGFPESKYAAEPAADSEEILPEQEERVLPEREEEPRSADDFFVLPGETLAKYGRSRYAESGEPDSSEFDADAADDAPPELLAEIPDQLIPEYDPQSNGVDAADSDVENGDEEAVLEDSGREEEVEDDEAFSADAEGAEVAPVKTAPQGSAGDGEADSSATDTEPLAGGAGQDSTLSGAVGIVPAMDQTPEGRGPRRRDRRGRGRGRRGSFSQQTSSDSESATATAGSSSAPEVFTSGGVQAEAEPATEASPGASLEIAPALASGTATESLALDDREVGEVMEELLSEEPETPEEAASLEEDGPSSETLAEEDGLNEDDAGEAAAFESADAGGTEAEDEGEDGAIADAESQPEEDEGPEPARRPQSLTATLREQGGGRYLQHRTSRRMRRKMRQQGRSDEAMPEPASTVPAPPTIAAAPVTEVREGRETRRGDRDRGGDRGAAEREQRAPQPSITDLLKEGQEILVQIAKEPLGQKGARITSHIALPGRYCVYMPTVEHLGVSRKIASDEERQRLKRILQTHRAGISGGFIVRTAGEGKTEEQIAGDVMFLFNLWLDIRQKAEAKPAPALIHHDLDVTQRLLRDQLNATYKNVWVDSEEIYEQVLRFVQRFQPALISKVKLYTRKDPIFDAFGVTQELEKALRPKVWLKSGGYIVINQTEALVAIDVNTGKFVGKSNRLEDTIVKTNTEAVKEIVRQVRLRDLGGIIVIDFIDMDERKNRQKVMLALEEAMRSDRAPYKILQFNDFGLVAITRKRVKQSLERTLCAPCPYCEGAGYVKSVETIIAEILQEAVKVASVVEGKDVVLRCNPEVAKVLKSHQNNYLEELEEVLKRPVIIRSDVQLHQEKFDLA
jgi:Rne/Rng family ribonuclease